MRKITAFACFFVVFLFTSALAANSFESALADKISEYGVYNGKEGVIYADTIEFETLSLLTVTAEGSDIRCEVYDDTDGLQLTDTLTLSCTGARACRLLTVKSGGKNFLMFSRGSENEFYTIENDAFITLPVTDYYPAAAIAASENGKITMLSEENSVYNFLNRLKAEHIKSYAFTNKINSLQAEERVKIKTTLSACADIMRFDIKNYDYDTLFKYILYTHKNFRVLTDIDPESAESSALGYNSVHLVSAEFIDYIMENVFRLNAEKPPVNSLVTRGFCYNNGFYLYSGGFDMYYATDISELIATYDLGGNVVYVIFSDMYYEGDTKTPEYSFALLQKTGESYSLLRLGMGEALLSEDEVKAYSPFSVYGGSIWERDKKMPDTPEKKSEALFAVFLSVIAIGTVGLICSVIVLLKLRK